MRSNLMFAILIVLASGCHLGPRWSRHLELLNAEKRTLEDEVYALQDNLDDAVGELKDLHRENENLRQRLGEPSRPLTVPERPKSPRRPDAIGPELSPPMIDEGILQEPKIEIPESGSAIERNSKPSAAPPAPLPGSEAIPAAVPPGTLPSPAWQIETSDPRVTHIVLNPLLTGGTDFNREPGDDGLVVLIEPRNRDDVFVPIPGPISVVLLDPEREGEQARFAQWKVDAPSANRQLENSVKMKGIHLRLPWPQSPPKNSRMHLFVRYVTVDGRTLEANREIFLSLPGQLSQRWMPRSPRRAEEQGTSASRVERAAYLEAPTTPAGEPAAPRESVIFQTQPPLQPIPPPQRPAWRPTRS